MQDVANSLDIEKGLLLPGKRGIRQVFGGGGRTHGKRQVGRPVGQADKRIADGLFQLLRERLRFDHLAYLRTCHRQRTDIVDIQRV